MRRISVIDFIKERDQWRENVSRDADGSIVIDPDDDIVCDLCNADVTEDPLYIDAGYLICPECRARRKK